MTSVGVRTRSFSHDVYEPMSVVETGTLLLVNGLEVACQDGCWNEKHKKTHHARVNLLPEQLECAT